MKMLIKRMRAVWAALVVVLIAGAVGTVTAGTASAADVSGSATATTSALTKKQKKAKKKALKKCKKQRKAKKRRACIKRVNKKYRKLAKRNVTPSGKTVEVDVMDDYYSPGLVQLKVYDWIRWDWKKSTSREGHNVSLMSGPSGVSPFDFESPIMSGPNGNFKRQFVKAGTYNLFCTLHAGMTMDVQVSK